MAYAQNIQIEYPDKWMQVFCFGLIGRDECLKGYATRQCQCTHQRMAWHGMATHGIVADSWDNHLGRLRQPAVGHIFASFVIWRVFRCVCISATFLAILGIPAGCSSQKNMISWRFSQFDLQSRYGAHWLLLKFRRSGDMSWETCTRPWGCLTYLDPINSGRVALSGVLLFLRPAWAFSQASNCRLSSVAMTFVSHDSLEFSCRCVLQANDNYSWQILHYQSHSHRQCCSMLLSVRMIDCAGDHFHQ